MATPHYPVLVPPMYNGSLTSSQLESIPLFQNPRPQSKSYRSFIPVLIKTQWNSTFISDDDGNQYTIVDDIYSKVLQVLVKDADISLQAFVERKSPQDQQRIKSKPKSTHVQDRAVFLSVIVYGPPVLFESVGNFLDRCSVFLQRPLRCDRNVPYRNPQSLSGEDSHAPLTMELEGRFPTAEIETLNYTANLAAALETGDTFPETDAPVGIRTSLYRNIASPSVTQSTPLVTPLSLLSSWETEFDTHLEPLALKRWKYYAPNRQKSAHMLSESDIVMTTYDIVALEWQKLEASVTPLFAVNWHRVILDEAHEIRSGNSRRAKAVYALRGERRWAITGTPIQNRWEDLASLLHFIKTYPDEDLRSLKRVLGRSAHDLLVKAMLTSICLRRPKASISLPPRVDRLHKVDFDEEEAAYYNAAKNAVMAYLTQRADAPNFVTTTNMLAQTNTLRQISDLGLHYKPPSHASQAETPKMSPQEQFDGLVASAMAVCSCCGKDLAQAEEPNASASYESERLEIPTSWMSTCGENIICGMCFRTYQTEFPLTKHGCEHQPVCELVAIDTSFSSCATLDPFPAGLPAKLKQLQKDLLDLPKNDKIIIFSFWTSTLDLVSTALTDIQISFVRFDGTTPHAERQRALDVFRTDPATRVILISLRCGANGLNLTAANHVFLMEPQWNPALEDQAMDRVHRMGQTKEVTTVRYIVKDTIEEVW
ncbi:MAG: hypothetical protein Q9225_007829 [Loekoesia sp. 1 TL-2023]